MTATGVIRPALPLVSGLAAIRATAVAPAADPGAYVQSRRGGYGLHLIVDNMSCPACVPDIEDALGGLDGVAAVRVNLSQARVTVHWRDGAFDPLRIVQTLAALGYRAIPYDPAVLDRLRDDRDRRLLQAMAVAGFAAANIMLLSVSVWSGRGAEMGPATRDFFHWISALIALPAVAYAGQPFFASAWVALRVRRVNMDVPISLGVLLACVASVMETLRSAPHAYFDATVMLLFFLLLGRYLDQHVRARATGIAANLLALKGVAATVIGADGRRQSVPVDSLMPGMRIAVAPGDRIPADGVIRRGCSDIDASMVTGESLPAAHRPGDMVYAGTLCLSGSLEVQVTRSADDTLLGQLAALVENAAQARARMVRLADRAARIYAPAVHVLAAGTFIGWLAIGGGWHAALMAAIAVLIITCPCAIGLAVPAVQAVATARLMRAGVLVKAADAFERLAQVDTVVLDKTGTLTVGYPTLVPDAGRDPAALTLAARLAAGSRHPLCAALVHAAAGGTVPLPVREHPGMGLEAELDGTPVRLGNRVWCRIAETELSPPGESELWLCSGDGHAIRFGFTDRLRGDAAAAVAALRALGLSVEILSGDRPAAVASVAKALGIADARAGAQPQDKIVRLRSLAAEGRRVLMIGDGLNDAPALAAAHVSISPASAADISQVAADVLFRGEMLMPVAEALRVARDVRRRVLENFAIAVGYNAVAVPLAMTGQLTPLIAAVAMSTSSLIVVLNALRIGRRSGA